MLSETPRRLIEVQDQVTLKGQVTPRHQVHLMALLVRFKSEFAFCNSLDELAAAAVSLLQAMSDSDEWIRQFYFYSLQVLQHLRAAQYGETWRQFNSTLVSFQGLLDAERR